MKLSQPKRVEDTGRLRVIDHKQNKYSYIVVLEVDGLSDRKYKIDVPQNYEYWQVRNMINDYNSGKRTFSFIL